jgi:hypothetical protein
MDSRNKRLVVREGVFSKGEVVETYREGTEACRSEASIPAPQFNSYLLGALGIALISVVALYWVRARVGLTFMEFGDETEYFVAAQMMAKGHHLYGDVFMQHGPLPIMITQLYTAVFSSSDFSYIRIAVIVLMGVSALSIWLSPILKTSIAKITVLTVYLSLLCAVWLPAYMNMLVYPSVGGYLSVVLLAQCVLPLVFHEKITSWNYGIAGVSVALAGFSASQFFLSSTLFALAAIVSAPRGSFTAPRHLTVFLSAGIGISAAVAVWLWLFADVPGYLIDHIYFNQAIYSKFVDFTPLSILKNISVSLAPSKGMHTAALALLCAWIGLLLWNKPRPYPEQSLGRRASSVALISLGILFTNPIGDFLSHDNPFLICNFALFALAIGLYTQRSMPASLRSSTVWVVLPVIAAITALEVTGARALSELRSTNPSGVVARLKPQADSIYQFVRSVTREEGDLLSLAYNPIVYIRAGRLPASGTFFYLPWQAAYNRNAFRGYAFDVCADIEQKRPAVIWFFNWRVWDKYPIEIYEPCVLPLIVKYYAPTGFNSPWYVRADVLQQYKGPLPRDYDSEEWTKTLQRSERTAAGGVELVMTSEHEKRPLELRRIGVLFASNSYQGEARLLLRSPDGATFSSEFSLATVKPDRYQFFDLRPGVYRSGDVEPVTGGELSVWEGHWDQTSTCIIYEYVDFSRAYTPSCPMRDPLEHSGAVPVPPSQTNRD